MPNTLEALIFNFVLRSLILENGTEFSMLARRGQDVVVYLEGFLPIYLAWIKGVTAGQGVFNVIEARSFSGRGLQSLISAGLLLTRPSLVHMEL
jgi:hypothetical protein